MNNHTHNPFSPTAPPIVFLICLMMFPQIVETIYSPALPLIAHHFLVSQADASQTISLYFIAFAVGIIVWGFLCDSLGRRYAVLIALTLYILASLIALFSTQFSILLSARMLMAFAAAIGSIGSQTILRDLFTGEKLRHVFTHVGLALAISPAIGLILGYIMVAINGYHAVFQILTAFGFLLFLWAFYRLPETKEQTFSRSSVMSVLSLMLKDRQIWQSALLVALLNIMIFSYYQLAPFIFYTLNLDPLIYSLSGILLSAGALLGAIINRKLISHHYCATTLISISLLIALISSLLLYAFEQSWFFIIPMLGITVAYSMAIPNILSNALKDYQYALGAAGAVFGLIYYVVIGVGLMISGFVQSLGITLIVLTLLSLGIHFIGRQKDHT